MSRTARLALLAALASLALPATALASPTQRTVIEDDGQLVLSDAATRARAFDDVSALGADTIHSIVFWNRIAPSPTSRHRPAGFDGSDPAAYPAAAWDPWDELVRSATARGVDVQLSPASPIPEWASGCRSGKRTTCRPDPTQFKRFVQALGTRYSGTYADEDAGGGTLPRVARWSVWNEPNQGGWLTPQFARVRGRTQPQSPAIYRALVRAAVKGLAASGHAHDELLLGETAPLGRETGSLSIRPMAPGAFLRGTLCLDDAGKALKGAAGAALDCTGSFPRLPVTGFAHHPYTRGGSQPPTSRGTSGEITVATASRLRAIIRQAAARRRVPAGLAISYTEFGFQTNPPDTLFGVSLAAQARYLNESDWLAYRDPSIRAVGQYELVDERKASAFQTGLRFLDGRAKPAYAAYRLPLWVSRQGSRYRIWGQVRPALDRARDTVLVERAPSGSARFATVARTTLRGSKGFVDLTVPAHSGAWRLSWTPPGGGAPLTSRVVAGPGR